jgi:hypothetical protein
MAEPFIPKTRRRLFANTVKHRDITLRNTQLETALICFTVRDLDNGAEKVYEIDIDPSQATDPSVDKPHGGLPLGTIASLLQYFIFTLIDTSVQNSKTYKIQADLSSVQDPVSVNQTNIDELTLLQLATYLGEIAFTVVDQSTKQAAGKYLIGGSMLASQPTPPLLTKNSVDNTPYKKLDSAEVFKLIELIKLTVSSSGSAAKKKKKFSVIGTYNVRPKLHCE